MDISLGWLNNMTFEEYKKKTYKELDDSIDDELRKSDNVSMYHYGFVDGEKRILDTLPFECPDKFEYNFGTSFDNLEDGAAYVVSFRDGVSIKEMVQALKMMNDKVKDRGISFIPKLPYMESVERKHD